MLRITEIYNGVTPGLRLEGRVIGPWVVELKSVCKFWLSEGRRPTLDLAGVTFADKAGIALLRDLRDQDVGLLNCSPFLALQLGLEPGRGDTNGGSGDVDL